MTPPRIRVSTAAATHPVPLVPSLHLRPSCATLRACATFKKARPSVIQETTPTPAPPTSSLSPGRADY
eukprot:688713-Hanusia_phi.AAC.1